MISTRFGPGADLPTLGISAISFWQPSLVLSNDWFDSMPRKFVQHTGIRQRPVSRVDEVDLAVQATHELVRESGCELDRCAGIVFTSPSLVPVGVARRLKNESAIAAVQQNRAARRVARKLGIRPRRIAATNTFCAGFAKALAIVQNKFLPDLDLQDDEFVVVLTSSRISQITDYGCRDTAGLFGDLATATLVTRADSQRFPVRFELVHVDVERKTTSRPFFDFHVQEQVTVPDGNGGQKIDPCRIVFSMDGMGIADTAPRAMASAASAMAEETGLQPDEVQFVVPHQAGSAIVRLAEMKLRDAGFTGEVINGMTREVGNISSGSIPYTLMKKWNELSGNIFCPIASVGPPGRPLVAQGCIALRATEPVSVTATADG